MRGEGGMIEECERKRVSTSCAVFTSTVGQFRQSVADSPV